MTGGNTGNILHGWQRVGRKPPQSRMYCSLSYFLYKLEETIMNINSSHRLDLLQKNKNTRFVIKDTSLSMDSFPLQLCGNQVKSIHSKSLFPLCYINSYMPLRATTRSKCMYRSNACGPLWIAPHCHWMAYQRMDEIARLLKMGFPEQVFSFQRYDTFRVQNIQFIYIFKNLQKH